MPIGRSQIPKQIEGKLRGARDEKRKVRVYSKGGIRNGKLKKVASALNKASKLHKKQSKIIKKHIKDMKRGRS
jgi:hypothetical protein|tara:strand:- start:907 stop:1125 length:219 start_codon:yes stop_codon:yes gene_type:complete